MRIYCDMKITNKSLKRLLNSQIERENFVHFVKLLRQQWSLALDFTHTPRSKRLFGLICFFMKVILTVVSMTFVPLMLYFSFWFEILLIIQILLLRSLFSKNSQVEWKFEYSLSRQKNFSNMQKPSWGMKIILLQAPDLPSLCHYFFMFDEATTMVDRKGNKFFYVQTWYSHKHLSFAKFIAHSLSPGAVCPSQLWKWISITLFIKSLLASLNDIFMNL